MYYNFNVEIPANTAKADKIVQACKMTYGFIRHVAVAFPPGPKGLAHLVIYRYESQIWPTNPDADFAWDNYTLEFNEDFALTDAPFRLTLHGWNEDDTYPHTVTVRFELVSETWGYDDLLSLKTPLSRLEDWES